MANDDERTGKMCIRNHFDADGNPAGGTVHGMGIHIRWQDGPLGRGVTRKAPNGAFITDVIQSVFYRLEFFQRSNFACDENDDALKHLRSAFNALNQRTKLRESRGVEGTHEI